jgi:flagellar assembly factor FliW
MIVDVHEPDETTAGAGDIPVLEMVEPMVGFPEQRRFALARLDDTGMICDLRSLDDPSLSFVVVPPGVFFDDYAPEIHDDLATSLGADSEQDLLTLVVLTLGETPAESTANLLAPIVVNHRTRRAGQVVLDDPALPVRAPLAPREHAPA